MSASSYMKGSDSMAKQGKEDKLLHELEHVKINASDNEFIGKLMDDTLKKKHKIWLSSDWHLYKRIKKGVSTCNKRPGFSKLMKALHRSVKDGDLLIFLGDLVDGEMKASLTLQNEIKANLSDIPNKIMLRGNNDLFDKEFYEKDCGFLRCCDGFVWKNILFTHCPQRNTEKYDMNIHGHIHASKCYWIPYVNHIDVCAFDGRDKPIELYWLMKQIKRYQKQITEDPSHFEEGYCIQPTQLDLFNIIMNDEYIPFIRDPFED